MEKQKSEFGQKILDIRRVVRVVAGGRRFSFRVTVALGDKRGKVGIGTAKGHDVTAAVEKAARQAKKHMITVELKGGTIPHQIDYKFKSVRIVLKPAKEGTGIIVGGAVRVVCALAGVRNITGKIVSKSTNKINTAKATIEAFKQLTYAATPTPTNARS